MLTPDKNIFNKFAVNLNYFFEIYFRTTKNISTKQYLGTISQSVLDRKKVLQPDRFFFDWNATEPRTIRIL